MPRAPKKRSTYIIHLIASIILILVVRFYEAASDGSRTSENIVAILNIAAFVYFIVSAYKLLFYKKYAASFQKKTESKENKGE